MSHPTEFVACRRPGRSVLGRVATALVLLTFAIGTSRAAGGEVVGKLVKVDLKEKILLVATAKGEQVIHVNAKTEFLGPKGGVSKERLHDKRLVRGVELKIIMVADGRMAHKVHIVGK